MAKGEEQIDWERQREQMRLASLMDFSESLPFASLPLNSDPQNALGLKDLPTSHISLR